MDTDPLDGAPSMRHRPMPGESAADKRPSLVAEWLTDRNGGISLLDLKPASGFIGWWKCAACTHEWKASIADRSGGHGCGRCGRERAARERQRPKPGESAADKNSHLVEEWLTERNNGVSLQALKPGSCVRGWWQCSKCGHQWQTTVNTRCQGRGSGCRPCATSRLSRPEPGKSAADKMPHLVDEWLTERNGGITLYDLKAAATMRGWWRCATCGHEWETAVYSRCKGAGSGCSPCAYKNRGPQRPKSADGTTGSGDSAASRRGDLVAEWLTDRNGNIALDELKPGSTFLGWWKCVTCGHEWQARVAGRVKGYGCARCGHAARAASLRVPKPGESAADRSPHLIGEWVSHLNGEATLFDLKPASTFRAWWQCAKCKNQWQAVLAERSRGRGCSRCSNQLSGQERALFLGLKNALPDLAQDVRLPRTGAHDRAPGYWSVDMFTIHEGCTNGNQGVVVEFDGEYWHGPDSPSKKQRERDVLKSTDLRGQGHTVIRVREGALEQLHPHDVIVKKGAPVDEVVAAVLDRLGQLGAYRQGTGSTAEHCAA